MPTTTNKPREPSRNPQGFKARKSLPEALKERLQAVWRRLRHLVGWCDGSEAWTKMFSSEARPYRATFYLESVAGMVSDYMLKHPEASPEDVLADCLVATRYSLSHEDRKRLTEFRRMWNEVLRSSKHEIEAFIQADLQLAAHEGTYETVARLYVADYWRWRIGEKPGAARKH